MNVIAFLSTNRNARFVSALLPDGDAQTLTPLPPLPRPLRQVVFSLLVGEMPEAEGAPTATRLASRWAPSVPASSAVRLCSVTSPHTGEEVTECCIGLIRDVAR